MADLYKLPISARPPNSWWQNFIGLLFGLTFDFGLIMVNATQFMFLLPLRLLPFQWADSLSNEVMRYTKGAFGCLLLLMCHWFAPTKFSITFERDGLGKLTQEEIQSIIIKNDKDQVVSLNFPPRFVLTANHQVYADWWYAWCLLYFIGPDGVHRDVYITLKRSLKWLPVVGWGMQFFNFIFLSRSWVSDRKQLSASLASLAEKTDKDDTPFAFVLYPEGTLVSKNTRPVSKKFSDKLGIVDMTHSLLPRSTGLHYSLRSLAPRTTDLKLLNLTWVYPGIPPLGYGQNYYTMRSIFVDGIAPPVIHLHVRLFDVSKDIPIGASIQRANPDFLPKSDSKDAVEVEIPDSEKTVFDEWLRGLWTEQDLSIDNFLHTGAFSKIRSAEADAEIPLKLRRVRDVLDAFCFFIPAATGWLTSRIPFTA